MERKHNILNKNYIILGFIILFLIRLLMNTLPSYKIDMDGYAAWGFYLADNGIKGFYDTFHVVYGPIYPYILWLSGIIARLFSMGQPGMEFIIKFWSVLFDFIGAYIIILIALKYKKEKLGLIAAAVYVMNPAIFFNSSIWGQFDTISTTMLLYVFYCFNFKKKVLGAVVFVLAIITKPQSAFLTPIIIIHYFVGFKFNKEYLKKVIYTIIFCIAAYTITTFAFEGGKGFLWLIPHYLSSGGDYPYATANAFNLWTVLGGQTVIDSNIFFGLSYFLWSSILFFIIILITSIMSVIRSKNIIGLYFAPFFISLGVFMFWSRMHERYMLQAFIFIAVCTIWEKRLWIPYIILSLCSFANVFYIYEKAKINIFWISNSNSTGNIIATISLIGTIYSFYYMYLLITRKEKRGILK